MDFKSPDGAHFPVLLPRRSLVVLTGAARYQFTHAITPRKSDVVPASGLCPGQVHTCRSPPPEGACAESHISSPAPGGDDGHTNTNKQQLCDSEKTSQSDGPRQGQPYDSRAAGKVDHASSRCHSDDLVGGANNSQERLTLVARGVRTSFTFRKVKMSPSCQCCE